MLDLTKQDDTDIEKGLTQNGEQLKRIPLPETLDGAIQAGLVQAKRRQSGSRYRTYMIAASLLALLLISVRISPALAGYVGSLPGMSSLIKLVAGDRGLESAVRNDFVQPVYASETKEGVTFELNGLIADEGRLNVFYAVRTEEPVANLYVGSVTVLDDATGEPLQASYSMSNAAPTKVRHGKSSRFEGRVDIQMAPGYPLPDRVRIEARLEVPGEVESTQWSAAVPVDKERFRNMKEVIPVDRTITVQGQSFRIDQVTVYPTRIGLDIEANPDNAKQLIYLMDVKLTDENGETYPSMGASSTLSVDRQTIYFESTYFTNPKHLTLSGSRIMALDKSKMALKLDLQHQQLLEAPDDRVRLIRAEPIPGDPTRYMFEFGVLANALEDHYGYTLVDTTFHDASGRNFEVDRFTSSTESNNPEQKVRFEAVLSAPFENPLTFPLVNYPSFVEEPFTLKLK